MARGLEGTALFGLGILLRQIGFIKLGTGNEDDDKKYGIETARGEQYTPYVYNPLTGEYVGLSVFAPACSPLVMGAIADKLFQEEDDIVDGLINASFAAGDQIFDASYMTGLSDVFRGRDGITENLVNALMSSVMSQSVPAIVSQIATALDPYVRDTKDKDKVVQALNTLISRIPVLRETLPEKVSITGESVQSKEGLRNLYDPFYITEAGNDPALDELMRLSDALGSSDFLPSDALSGTKTELKGVAALVTGKDKEAYKKRYGELWRLGGPTYNKNGGGVNITGVTDLIQTSAYQDMSDEEKASAIKEIIGLAKVGATYEIGETLGHVFTGGLADLPQTFQADMDEPYMQRAVDTWRATGEDSALPRPLDKFSYKKTEYVISEDEAETWNAIYKENYMAKLKQSEKTWDSLNDEEKLEALKAAHRAGHEAAKEWYMRIHNIK